MRKKNKTFLSIAISLLVIFFTFPLLSRTIWSVLAMGSSPKIVIDIYRDYQQYSSDKLIAMLNNFTSAYNFYYYSPYPYIALEVLVDRKDGKAVPTLINLLKIPDKNRRLTIIRSLGMMDDLRAIEPLLVIANLCPIDYKNSHSDAPDNIEALLSLARLKYDGVYEQAVGIASRTDDPNDLRSYGISMLEYFGKLESIPLLEKIGANDPKPYIRDKAKQAIGKIKGTVLFK